MEFLNSEVVKNMPLTDFVKYAKTVIDNKKSKLIIVEDYDLRLGLNQMSFDANPDYDWTIFINKIGDHLHIVKPNVRIVLKMKLEYSISHLSDEVIFQMIRDEFGSYTKI